MDMGSEIGSHKDALSPLDEDVEELTTRFKKIKPVPKQSLTDLESGDEGFFPMVLVQIPMCNEKEDNEELGLVQARWSFVNRDENLLTRILVGWLEKEPPLRTLDIAVRASSILWCEHEFILMKL
ncbi:hypothetical protein Tco_0740901, partial [Tanacetum coccineum]